MSNEMETTRFDGGTDLALPVNGADPGTEAALLFGGGIGGVVIDPAEGVGLIGPSLFGPPVIFSVQPSQIPAGTTSRVTLFGQNLPVNAGNYTVIDSTGFPTPNAVVTGAASGTPTAVSLAVAVSPFAPAGAYRIRVQNLGFVSEGALTIGATVGLRLDSVSPARIPAGATSTVTAAGANLPLAAVSYSVVDGFGARVPGVQILSASGTSTQVRLQVSVSSTAPLGGFSLRVEVPGTAALRPLEIFQGGGAVVLFSVTPNTLAAGRITRITLSGSNLPLNAGLYSLRSGVTGALVPATFGLVFAASNGSSITLNVALPATAPRGQAFLRAQAGDQGAEIPVFIV